MSNLKNLMAQIEARAKAAEKEKHKPNENQVGSLEENSVTKSNALARAYYRFGLVEKRVMEALISNLNPQIHPTQLQPITLKAVDYAKTFNVSEKHAYEHIGGAVDALLHRVITVIESNKIRKLNLTSEAIYEEKKGSITVTFSPLVVPHLVGLKRKFTKYPLKISANFKSSYTWRLYELLISWAQDPKLTDGILAGWFPVEVSELRKMLGVPSSYSWWMFSERVMNVAKKELLNKANIELEIETIKTGRKITHIKFTFAEERNEGKAKHQALEKKEPKQEIERCPNTIDMFEKA